MHIYKSGYHHQVCHICDVSSWYTMLSEVLCCGHVQRQAEVAEEEKWVGGLPETQQFYHNSARDTKPCSRQS